LNATLPGGVYQWYDAASGGNLLATGAAYTTPVLTTTTTYYVQTTVGGCIGARTAVTVIVNPIPAAPTVSGATICAGFATTLTAIATGGTYQWYDATSGGNLLGSGAGYTTPVLTTTTTYYVQRTVDGCASARTAVTVTATPTPAVPTASGITVCSGNIATLTATAPGGTYQWYDAATGGNLMGTGSSYTTPALTANTTYYVQTTVSGCTSLRSSVTVMVNPTPKVPEVISNSPVCTGSYIVLSTPEIAGASYSWTGPNGFTSTVQNPVINNTTGKNAGIYYVSVTVTGCTSSAGSTTVFVNEPAIAIAGNDQTVCVTAGVVPLAGIVSGGSSTGIWTSNGSGTFLPSNTTLNAKYIPSAADTTVRRVILTLTSTNNGGCMASVSSLVITFDKLPIVNAGADQAVCSNDAILGLNGVTNTGGGVWSSSGTGIFSPFNTSLNAVYIPSQSDIISGSILLTLSSTGNGVCSPVTDMMKVTIIPAPIVNAGFDIIILEKSSIILTPQVNDPNVQYLWIPNTNLNNDRVKNPILTGKQDQLYTLRVTNSLGCITESRILVKVLKPIIIPNTFTPNGDGVNDLWNIKELSKYPGATLEVYNRYGIKIYSSIGYYKPWDGTYYGNPMPSATYYYIIDTQFPGQVFSGSISIFR